MIGHEDAHASENASELDTSKSKHTKASKVLAAEVMARQPRGSARSGHDLAR